MFKAGATMKDGGKLVILGLQDELVERMQSTRQALDIDLSDFGLHGHLLILTGETTEGMAMMLREHVGPETNVHVDPRLDITEDKLRGAG